MSDELSLIVTVSYAGAIGYAELYECRVKERIVGTLEENKIRLTVLTSDKDKLSFLSSHLHPQEIELGFRMVRRKEPYGLAPISGFVDKQNTSWQVKYMREA
jgi:hypothetical protein